MDGINENNQENVAENTAENAELAFIDELNTEQLEQLYQQAFEAIEVVETGAQQIAAANDLPANETEDENNFSADNQKQTEKKQHEQNRSKPIGEMLAEQGSGANSSAERISPSRVIEAALFVGGSPLTAKKLRTLLRGNFADDFVEQTIDELNQLYRTEQRPYEILFGKGGYRMTLKSDFHTVQNRVFGIGPKEVKLSQEALEMLSLIAYQQPITPKKIAELRSDQTTSTLRNLVRRELIAIHRDTENRKQIDYRTTPRFLELFGLEHIDELPQADELHFK